MTGVRTPSTRSALLAVAFGAAAGALLRWGLGSVGGTGTGADWTLWWINVVGSGALGLVTGWASMQARPLLVLVLGPGLLGGFTSVSAATEDVRVLLDGGDVALAGWYLGSMLGAAVLAVHLGRACARAAAEGRRAGC